MAGILGAEAIGEMLGIIDTSQTAGWWRQTVATLDDGRLLAGVVAEVITVIGGVGLPPETLKRLLDTAGHFVGESWMPRLDASFPPHAGPSGYWPAEDAVAKIAGSDVTKLLGPFDVRTPDDYVQALLADEIAEAQLPAVLAALSFVEVSLIERDATALLRRCLPDLLGRSDASPCNPGYRRALALLTATMAATGPMVDCGELIAGQARRMAAQWPDAQLTSSVFEDNAEPHHGFSLLAELVFVAARHFAVPLADKVQWVARATESIVEAWPGSLNGAIIFIDRCIACLPVRQATPLWSAFNRLRARRL